MIVLAIIGGGIGGTSAAYFLRKHLAEQVQIELFNDGEIGGKHSSL